MKKFGGVMISAIYCFAGMLCGALIGEALFADKELTGGILLVLALFISFIVNIAFHEAGHLIFGLITGYRFISYRLGSLMLMKSGGKLRFGRMSIAGTGGQCLMLPPEPADGKVPCVLYNLGGSIVNLLFGGIMTAISAANEWNPILLMFGMIAIAMALANGIPFHAGLIDNDGMNAISLMKAPEAMNAFGTQFKIAAAQTDGMRLRDMPDEWFELPSAEGTESNALIASIAVFAENRLMDEYNFEAALELTDRLLSAKGVLGLHRQLLMLDRISCLYLLGRVDEADRLFCEKSNRKAMKQMRNFLMIPRTKYIAALLGKNGGDAAALHTEFDKLCQKYPYKGDIESERGLLCLADKALAAAEQ